MQIRRCLYESGLVASPKLIVPPCTQTKRNLWCYVLLRPLAVPPVRRYGGDAASTAAAGPPSSPMRVPVCSRSLSLFFLAPGGFILLRRSFFICSLCLFFCGVYLTRSTRKHTFERNTRRPEKKTPVKSNG